MAFRDFGTMDSVLREYPMEVRKQDFLPEVRLDLPDHFRESLRWSLLRRTGIDGEFYKTENILNPFLQLVWRRYPRLHVWSHQTISADARLTGSPDYLIAAEPVGIVDRLLQRPFVGVAEAKREDFDEGWGQCLAAMLACQILNGGPELSVYGIVSTGLFWEFGRLTGRQLTQQPSGYSVSDPELVYGMIDQVFAACDRQLPAA